MIDFLPNSDPEERWHDASPLHVKAWLVDKTGSQSQPLPRSGRSLGFTCALFLFDPRARREDCHHPRPKVSSRHERARTLVLSSRISIPVWITHPTPPLPLEHCRKLIDSLIFKLPVLLWPVSLDFIKLPFYALSRCFITLDVASHSGLISVVPVVLLLSLPICLRCTIVRQEV
ncbi:hypothetical protein F5888DRAFT_848989 [Russula emetica]|nr:hypothetical protein F5888DRAFT_848989 [Russula emetica]